MKLKKKYSEIAPLMWLFYDFKKLVDNINHPLLKVSLIFLIAYLNQNGSDIQISKEDEKIVQNIIGEKETGHRLVRKTSDTRSDSVAA